MKLLLRRDQRSGTFGKITFTLDVRADITDDEQSNIRKYKLGDTVLYQSHEIEGGSGLLGVASRMAFKAMTIHVTVDDLARGKRIECKDVGELLAIEDQIKGAAVTFGQILRAAASFGGEEVIEI